MRICASALSAGSSASMSPHRFAQLPGIAHHGEGAAIAAAGAPVRMPILCTKVGRSD